MYGIIAIAGVIAFAAWTGAVWSYVSDAAVAGYQKREAVAQAKIDAQAKELEQQAANTVIDMTAAFDAGQAKAKVIERVVIERGATDVRSYPVFQNPACVLPSESFALVNAARASIRTGELPAAALNATPGKVVVPAVVPAMTAPPPVTESHPKPKPVRKQ